MSEKAKENKRMGRPPIDGVKRVSMSASVPIPTVQRVRQHASETGESVSAVVVAAITEYLERRQ